MNRFVVGVFTGVVLFCFLKKTTQDSYIDIGELEDLIEYY